MTRFFYTWHYSFIHDILLYTWHDSFIRDMTHSDLTRLILTWHHSFIHADDIDRALLRTYRALLRICRALFHLYMTRLILTWHHPSICDTTHSYVTWIIHSHYHSLLTMPREHHTSNIVGQNMFPSHLKSEGNVFCIYHTTDPPLAAVDATWVPYF